MSNQGIQIISNLMCTREKLKVHLLKGYNEYNERSFEKNYQVQQKSVKGLSLLHRETDQSSGRRAFWSPAKAVEISFNKSPLHPLPELDGSSSHKTRRTG